MSNTQPRRPVSDTRPARRSLVELTAAASRVVDDGLLVTPGSVIAASPDDLLRLEQAANAPDPAVAAAPITVAVPESPITAASHGLVDSDSSAEMVVKIAKDYQNRAFENIKVSLNAALDHSMDFVEKRAESEGASRGHGSAGLESNFLAVFNGASAEFRTEALELIKANMITTLEYARELAGTTTAAEFVELSGRHARKQCELMLKQAGALKSLAQAIAKSDAY
jgi:Phasin protein